MLVDLFLINPAARDCDVISNDIRKFNNIYFALDDHIEAFECIIQATQNHV